jgi:branched-chain amino acid transport system substrate-binding protein
MVGLTTAAEAQISIKLGVLTDRSGAYSDIGGEGSAVAARMAVEDFVSIGPLTASSQCQDGKS